MQGEGIAPGVMAAGVVVIEVVLIEAVGRTTSRACDEVLPCVG